MQTIFVYIPIFVCIKSHILKCMEMEYLQVQVKPKEKRVMLIKCNLKYSYAWTTWLMLLEAEHKCFHKCHSFYIILEKDMVARINWISNAKA
jgi:hypothetical protein